MLQQFDLELLEYYQSCQALQSTGQIFSHPGRVGVDIKYRPLLYMFGSRHQRTAQPITLWWVIKSWSFFFFFLLYVIEISLKAQSAIKVHRKYIREMPI